MSKFIIYEDLKNIKFQKKDYNFIKNYYIKMTFFLT